MSEENDIYGMKDEENMMTEEKKKDSKTKGIFSQEFYEKKMNLEKGSLSSYFDFGKIMIKRLLLEFSCFGLTGLAFIISAIVLSFSLYYSYTNIDRIHSEMVCKQTCEYSIVESIPIKFDLQPHPNSKPTHKSWISLFNSAKTSIKIGAFYISLLHSPKGEYGDEVFNTIIAAKKRGVRVQIVVNYPYLQKTDDYQKLLDNGIEIINIHWKRITSGGILHTKVIIIDDHSFYVGSANMDWKSLSQVKELGVEVKNCPCLNLDIKKVWRIYEYVALNLNSSLDPTSVNTLTHQMFRGWPENCNTEINSKNRFAVDFVHKSIQNLKNDIVQSFSYEKNKNENIDEIEKGSVFITSSPKTINSEKRENDINAVINTINNATETLSLSVMTFYQMPQFLKNKHFWWDEIDTALRSAMFRNVKIKFLVSHWNHTDPSQYVFLNTLKVFGRVCDQMFPNQPKRKWCNGTIDVKIFTVPDAIGQPVYPFTRVNHAKYIVSEKQALISTSNWTWDYFYTTGGISFISTHKKLVKTVHEIFERDWNSKFAKDLDFYLKKFNLN